MAILSKTGITTGATIQVGHVTQSIDAFTGTTQYDIILSGSLTITGSTKITGSISGSSFTGSFTGSLNGDATAASYINNNNLPGYAPKGGGGNFLPGSLGILAGSITLASGISSVINPLALTGRTFQTQYWVTATKASGSTSPGNNALMVEETAPNSGAFLIKDIGASTNDDVNFIVVYIKL
jgi:hypothetical protein